jgi:hypothetical protein
MESRSVHHSWSGSTNSVCTWLLACRFSWLRLFTLCSSGLRTRVIWVHEHQRFEYMCHPTSTIRVEMSKAKRRLGYRQNWFVPSTPTRGLIIHVRWNLFILYKLTAFSHTSSLNVYLRNTDIGLNDITAQTTTQYPLRETAILIIFRSNEVIIKNIFLNFLFKINFLYVQNTRCI